MRIIQGSALATAASSAKILLARGMKVLVVAAVRVVARAKLAAVPC